MNKNSIAFWSNVFIGVFSSGMLVFILSVASYRIERRRTLEKFYASVQEIINNINQYDKQDDPEKTMDVVLEMNKYNYTDFETSFGDIDFIFNKNKNGKYIYEEIYKKICDSRNMLAEKSFHFAEYKKAKHGNLAVMKLFIDDIDAAIMDRTEKKVINKEGIEITMGYSYNLLADELSEELSGRFYELMYSKSHNNKKT
jgi:hypothetical protein